MSSNLHARFSHQGCQVTRQTNPLSVARLNLTNRHNTLPLTLTTRLIYLHQTTVCSPSVNSSPLPMLQLVSDILIPLIVAMSSSIGAAAGMYTNGTTNEPAFHTPASTLPLNLQLAKALRADIRHPAPRLRRSSTPSPLFLSGPAGRPVF